VWLKFAHFVEGVKTKKKELPKWKKLTRKKARGQPGQASPNLPQTGNGNENRASFFKHTLGKSFACLFF